MCLVSFIYQARPIPAQRKVVTACFHQPHEGIADPAFVRSLAGLDRFKAREAIVADPSEASTVTSRANLVAVITNGTAVLGLGSIGPLAAKPVM